MALAEGVYGMITLAMAYETETGTRTHRGPLEW